MKSRNKVANISLGVLQYLASACAIPPAFICDLVCYMWQNRSSPFKEDDDKNDPPLETPFTEKMMDFRNNGVLKIVKSIGKDLPEKQQKDLADKYSKAISFAARFLMMSLVTGLSIAGAVATFPAGMIVLSLVIVAGTTGIINSAKKLIKTCGEIVAVKKGAGLSQRVDQDLASLQPPTRIEVRRSRSRTSDEPVELGSGLPKKSDRKTKIIKPKAARAGLILPLK